MSAIVTLTTDFGSGSPYVAAMKGVILGINPAANIVDISHEIAPQQVRPGAIVLAEASAWFTAHTIHVAVVDPGVGSRRLVYARIGDQQYLAPDNGLLSLLAQRTRPSRLIELANSEYWLPHVSHTFHGRDILAPVAAQLSLGLEPERLGPTAQEILMLDWPEPRRSGSRIDGVVQWIDRFGNLITNIPAGLLDSSAAPGTVRISCAAAVVTGLSHRYADRAPGEPIALFGSSGFLELAVNTGSAAQKLCVDVGTPVVVQW